MGLETLVVVTEAGETELDISVGWTMIIISWITFFLSWIVNISDYVFVHPSKPDTDLGRFSSKLIIYILGRRFEIISGDCSF